MDRQQYGEKFRQVIDYIEAGDCYQVNLAQRFSAQFTGDSWHAYRALREVAPTPFAAYLPTPTGDLLSLSPERFIQSCGIEVETKPIKGTRPRGQTASEDTQLAEALRNSPKDRAENLMIVDLLRNDLGKTCSIGSVRVPKLFEVETYANVHHLVSTICGRLDHPGK
jgi:para-aminobenzoate synthetase component 1